MDFAWNWVWKKTPTILSINHWNLNALKEVIIIGEDCKIMAKGISLTEIYT